MGMTGWTTYIAVVYSRPINVAANFSYMSAIIVTCVNIAGSKLVTKMTEIEGWPSRAETKVHFMASITDVLWHYPAMSGLVIAKCISPLGKQSFYPTLNSE